MDKWIIIMSLIVAGLALIAAGIIYLRYRHMERVKNRKIYDQLHEYDRLATQVEHARIENKVLEELIKGKLDKAGNPTDTAEENNTDNEK